MNRKELYTEILSTILIEHSILVTDIDVVQSELDMNGVTDALGVLERNLRDEKLKCIIKSMNEKCNEEELVNYEVLDAKRESFNLLSQKRDYNSNSPDLTVLNCDCFFNKTSYDDTTMLAFEKICIVEESRKDFLSYVLSSDGRNEYYVIP